MGATHSHHEKYLIKYTGDPDNFLDHGLPTWSGIYENDSFDLTWDLSNKKISED